MIRKQITRTLHITLITLLTLSPFCNLLPYENMPPQQMMGPGNQMITPEDLQAMELAVEKERANMSPEERAQFDNDVEQLTKELEAMKPEELESFMSQVLFGQPEQAPVMPPEETRIVAPPAPVATPAAKPEPVKSPKVLKKQDEALVRIDGIINHTTHFLNKIARYIEFTGKLKKWSEQGKITGWKQSDSWDSIKKQIEDLVAKLTTMKAKDPKTNDYRYLNDLIEDESLFNNLGKFKDALAKLEPDIEIDDFGLEPVSRQVRYVIRKVLAEYIEALTVSHIPAGLDKIIAKYEPTAKKHREEDAMNVKKASEHQLKQQNTKTPTVVAGKGDRGNSYSNYGSGSNPYDYYPYSSGGGYSPSSYDYAPSSAYQAPTPPSASSGSSGSGSRSGGGSSKSSDDSKSDKDKKSDDKKSDDEKSDSKVRSSSANKRGPKLDDKVYEKRQGESKKEEKAKKNVKNIQDAFDKAMEEIKEAEMAKLDSYIFDKELDAKRQKEKNEKLPRAIQATNQHLTDLINFLEKVGDIKALAPALKKRLQDIFNQHKKSVEAVITSIQKIKDNEKDISDPKQIVFDIGPKGPTFKKEESDREKKKEELEEAVIDEDDKTAVEIAKEKAEKERMLKELQEAPIKPTQYELYSPYQLAINFEQISNIYKEMFK